ARIAHMEQQTCWVSTEHDALRSRRGGGGAAICLDRSMGKKIKSREAHKRAAEAAISARLCAHSRVDTGPAFITSFGEFAPGYRAKVEAFRACALRPPELWRCRLRSRAPEKRFLELVRFTFARYRVPAHLENVWIEDAHALAAHRGAGHDGDRDTDWNHYFRSWYIVATQGGSLYRQAGA